MKLIYERHFLHDVKSIREITVKKNIHKTLDILRNSDDIMQLSQVKKIKGYKNAYRIRIGNYRLGFFVEKNTIILTRALHRKKIYKYFPK